MQKSRARVPIERKTMKPDIEAIKKYWLTSVMRVPSSYVERRAGEDIRLLIAEIESLREKLAAATEALGDMAANKSSLADGIRNLQQAYIAELGNVETLEKKLAAAGDKETWRLREVLNNEIDAHTKVKEKLALSEAAGADARHALEMLRELYVLRINGGKTLTILDNHIIVAMNKALSSSHGKAFLDVVQAAEKMKGALSALGGPAPTAQQFNNSEAAYKELSAALDRLPGRGSETTNPSTTSY